MRRDTFKRHALCFLCAPATLFFVALYALVIATRIRVGHWPYYAHPDMGSDGGPFYNAYIFVGLLSLLAYASGPVGLLLGIFAKWRGKRGLFRYSLYVVLTWMLGFAVLYLGPDQFLDWFLD